MVLSYKYLNKKIAPPAPAMLEALRAGLAMYNNRPILAQKIHFAKPIFL